MRVRGGGSGESIEFPNKNLTQKTEASEGGFFLGRAAMQIPHSWALMHEGCFADGLTALIPLPGGTETSGPNPETGRAGGGAGFGAAPARGGEPKGS